MPWEPQASSLGQRPVGAGLRAFFFGDIGILLLFFGLRRFGGGLFWLGGFCGFRDFFFRGLGSGCFLFREQGVEIFPAAAKVQVPLSSENRHEIQVVTHDFCLLLCFGMKKDHRAPFRVGYGLFVWSYFGFCVGRVTAGRTGP